MSLVPCPSCARHVRERESVCPFCASLMPEGLRAPVPPSGRISRAAMIALASTLSAAACSSSPPPGTNNVTEAPPAPPPPPVAVVSADVPPATPVVETPDAAAPEPADVPAVDVAVADVATDVHDAGRRPVTPRRPPGTVVDHGAPTVRYGAPSQPWSV